MTESERAAVLLCSRLLRAYAVVSWLSLGLGLGVALMIFQGVLHGVASVAVVVAGLLGSYWVVRIEFDARVLADAAARSWQGSVVDDALRELGLRSSSNAGRAWEARCKGALRLVKVHALLFLVQCAAAGVLAIGLSTR